MVNDESSFIKDITGLHLLCLCIVCGFLLLCVFAPLILSLIEQFMFGTNQVEDFCRVIGVHDLLGKIYDPILNFINY